MARWNLFFRILIFQVVALSANQVGAINLHALYTASCQREVGIILDVTPRQVFLLNLAGEITPVERYEIIYFATYPLDIVPMSEVKNPSLVPLVEIKTLRQNEMKTLVRGWPVDFSKDKIAFLSLRGSELVIDRSSIWSVEYDREGTSAHFTTRPSNNYEFIHPYAFANCPTSKGPDRRTVKIAPQQLLSDPVAIKRELDRLSLGHKEVRQYERDQQFFPVPEIYGNETSLGIWLSSPSRYGASGNRKNNFTPLLVNDMSGGPFGFQSRFLTGAAPMPFSIHEEVQTLAYYRMKADYFHFQGMVDPSLLLVGSRYSWQSADLDSTDVRANDTAFLEFGFDYGRWAVEIGAGGATNLATQSGDIFVKKSLSLPRFGLRYQLPHWLFHILAGSGSNEGAKINLIRTNIEYQRGKDQKYILSLIKRTMGFDGTVKRSETDLVHLDVQSEAETIAAYAYFKFKTRYWFGLNFSLENNAIKADNGENKTHIFPKGATYLSLTF